MSGSISLRSIALLVAVVAIAVAGVGVGVASPQPYPLCSPCGASFGAAAGEDVNVTESRVTVQLHENGSATWTVRNHLTGDGVAELREDDARLERVGREAATSGRDVRGWPGDAEGLHFWMDGDVAVLRFRDPEAATVAPFDALVVSYFRFHGYNPGIYVNAERFDLRTPAGYALSGRSDFAADETASHPDATTVRLDGETWTGEREGTRTRFTGDVDLIALPDEAPAGASTLAIVSTDWDVLVTNFKVVFGPGLVSAVLAAAFGGRVVFGSGGVSRRSELLSGACGGAAYLTFVARFSDPFGFFQIWPPFTLTFAGIGILIGFATAIVASAVHLLRCGGPPRLHND